jgi:hypothetical protein
VGRRSVWSDERVIELAAQFVPAADEVWRLQRDDDSDCRWFRKAVRGSEEPSAGTMQGIYVLTADGVCLGALNSNGSDAVLDMMQRALARWEQRRTEAAAPGKPFEALEPKHRWEDSYPQDGLVLERFARDIGTEPAAEPLRPVNRDAVWFAATECGSLAPPREPAGHSWQVGSVVVERLAATVLVDNVRGQTLPFASIEVAEATLRGRIVSESADEVAVAFDGRTRAEAGEDWHLGDTYWKPERSWPRSVQTTIYGEGVYHRGRGRWQRLELVALGQRTGRTQFNGRWREGADQEMRPIGFLLRLAPDDYRVAPTFLNVYGASWVKMPADTARR